MDAGPKRETKKGKKSPKWVSSRCFEAYAHSEKKKEVDILLSDNNILYYFLKNINIYFKHNISIFIPISFLDISISK